MTERRRKRTKERGGRKLVSGSSSTSRIPPSPTPLEATAREENDRTLLKNLLIPLTQSSGKFPTKEASKQEQRLDEFTASSLSLLRAHPNSPLDELHPPFAIQDFLVNGVLGRVLSKMLFKEFLNKRKDGRSD